MEPTKTALIDADLLLYGLACAFSTKCDFGDTEEPEYILDLRGAEDKLLRIINDLMCITGCHEAIFCFSCPKDKNYRYDLYPNYKHNRKGTVKPQLFDKLREYLEESEVPRWSILEGEAIEADDLLGLLAEAGTTTICSFDKDLDTIPGEHYDWRNQFLYNVELEDADLFFWTQCLTGDPTDGYPGVPGVGPVRAKRWLADVYCEEDAWNVIRKAYEYKEVSQEDALIQCRLARILRVGEIDENNQPILWVPKGYKESADESPH